MGGVKRALEGEQSWKLALKTDENMNPARFLFNTAAGVKILGAVGMGAGIALSLLGMSPVGFIAAGIGLVGYGVAAMYQKGIIEDAMHEAESTLGTSSSYRSINNRAFIAGLNPLNMLPV